MPLPLPLSPPSAAAAVPTPSALCAAAASAQIDHEQGTKCLQQARKQRAVHQGYICPAFQLRSITFDPTTPLTRCCSRDVHDLRHARQPLPLALDRRCLLGSCDQKYHRRSNQVYPVALIKHEEQLACCTLVPAKVSPSQGTLTCRAVSIHRGTAAQPCPGPTYGCNASSPYNPLVSSMDPNASLQLSRSMALAKLSCWPCVGSSHLSWHSSSAAALDGMQPAHGEQRSWVRGTWSLHVAACVKARV